MMRNSFMRSSAVLLALCGLMLRALLPAGWMPGPANAAPLIICAMDGLHRINPVGDHKQDPASHQDSQMCPFAAAAHLAPPAMPYAVLPSFTFAALETRIPKQIVAANSAPDLTHGPRAPPSLT